MVFSEDYGDLADCSTTCFICCLKCLDNVIQLQAPPRGKDFSYAIYRCHYNLVQLSRVEKLRLIGESIVQGFNNSLDKRPVGQQREGKWVFSTRNLPHSLLLLPRTYFPRFNLLPSSFTMISTRVLHFLIKSWISHRSIQEGKLSLFRKSGLFSRPFRYAFEIFIKRLPGFHTCP